MNAKKSTFISKYIGINERQVHLKTLTRSLELFSCIKKEFYTIHASLILQSRTGTHYSLFAMNEFRYIVGVDEAVQAGLSLWDAKIREYIELYYDGNRENAQDTDFYRCISKTTEITNNLIEKEDSLMFLLDLEQKRNSAT